MGHNINAMIGGRNALAGLAARFGPPDPVDLPFDLVIIPLDENRLDAVARSDEPAFHGFTYLTPTMARELGNAVGDSPALYIETDYFGGAGGQAAALFEDGAMIWKRSESTFEAAASQSLITRLLKPVVAAPRSPISEGLARLGVLASDGQDEFERVGLGRYRSLEDLGLDQDD